MPVPPPRSSAAHCSLQSIVPFQRGSSPVGPLATALLFVLCVLPALAGDATAQYSPNAPGLRITELMASNVAAHQNDDQDYEDWIELHNPTDHPIDLAGLYLSDEYPPDDLCAVPDTPAQQTTVPANGYVILYADHKPLRGPLHLDFKLDKEGEQVVLIGRDAATVLDSVTFPQQFRDVSYGRDPDGNSTWLYFDEPTPGAPNGYGYAGYAHRPLIQQDTGVYAQELAVSMEPEGVDETVRYTLDGTDPTQASPEYVAPVAISRNTVVRARAFRPDALPSEIASRAFFIGVSHALPVLALIINPADLYDPDTGIFVHDLPGRAWERPAELNLLEDQQLAFTMPAGVRLQGNTGPQEYEKKSLGLFFRGGYGDGDLDYALWPGDEVDSFEQFVLRSGYDDSMEPSETGNPRPTLLRDPLVTELWRQTGQLAPLSRFAVLYLNDGFHGIYDVKQDIDQDFVRDHLGYDQVDVLRTRWDCVEVVHGDREEWDNLIRFLTDNTLKDDARLAEAAAKLDLESFTTLQALIHATHYSKWAYNTFVFRQDVPDATWKWTVWDADRAFSDINWNGFTTLFNPLNRDLDSLMTRKLLANQSYRDYFVNRVADLLNTVFAPQNVIAIIDSLAQSVAPEIPAEVGLWGNTVQNWKDNVAFLKTFGRQRPGVVRKQMQEHFGLDGQATLAVDAVGQGTVQVNSVTLDNFPWSGTYFDGVPVTLTAVPAAGLRFAGWAEAGLPDKPTITLNLAEDTSVTAVFSTSGAIQAELVAPQRVPPGQRLPFVVRLRDPDGNINIVEQTPIHVTFGPAHADTSIAIKRGAGTGAVTVQGNADFPLTVSNAVVPPTRKIIQVSSRPVIEYSDSLAPGTVVWDRTADRLLTGNVIVPPGCHLIIEPGTWVIGQHATNIIVYGGITVSGTPEEPVIFTSEREKEPWGGVEVHRVQGSFSHCMVLNGGGDYSRGLWHTGRQHIFYGTNFADLSFDQCFFLYSPGKVFGAVDCRISLTNCVSSFVWHGGETFRSLLFYQNSHIMNIPNDDHVYESDIDTDGLHIATTSTRYPGYSVIDRCYFVTGKDDAIDQGAAKMRITNCWLEDWIHEGVAASGGDTVVIKNTVAIGNEQGFEAGYTDTAKGVTRGPIVYIDHSVAVGNDVGLRIGDSYLYECRGYVQMTNSILHGNNDNILNYLHNTQAPLEGAIDISYSMTNDPEYDESPHCITGVPQFDDHMYLLPNSPGAGAAMYGTDMGRADSAVVHLASTAVSGPASQAEESSQPLEFQLGQNFPNPFNPDTRIQFVLPAPGRVELVIYDLLGQRVGKLLDNQLLGAGGHSVRLDGSELSAGVYLYQLRFAGHNGGRRHRTRKMVLAR